jgi:hypothetical protein
MLGEDWKKEQRNNDATKEKEARRIQKEEGCRPGGTASSRLAFSGIVIAG